MDLARALSAFSLLLLTTYPAPRHGGEYRPVPPIQPPSPPPRNDQAPKDAVPTGGPRSGAPASGGGARPAGQPGPLTPGPGKPGPSAPTGGPKGAGITLTEDYSRWLYWWEFNKDLYLARHARVVPDGAASSATSAGPTRPSERDVERELVPALLQASCSTRQRDIVTSALLAAARVARQDHEVLPVLRRFLGETDQEMSEVAALSMGILGSRAALADLAAVVADGVAGRGLVGRPAGVPARTRSFASYAMGLIAYEHKDAALHQRVLATLAPVLTRMAASERDLRVAAVSALGLLAVDAGESYAGAVICDQAARALLAFYDDPRARHDLARAHVPTALARLVVADRDLRPHCVERLHADLVDAAENELVRQSCAIALGALARPDEDAVSASLLQLYDKGRDARARNLALVALGQIGGARNKTRLLARLCDARKMDRPWAALGLAVLARAATGRQQPDVAAGIGAAIAAELDGARNKNPQNRAGHGIALGIMQHDAAAGAVLGLLRDEARNDEVCGLAAVALGLMGHGAARDPLHALLAESTRRPVRLRNVAIALGQLEDETAADYLLGLLGTLASKESLSAVATALGRVGDRRCMRPLLAMLADGKVDERSRSYAATALGLLADRRDLPWNAPYAIGLNFHASCETLADGLGGVLDIL